MATAEWRDVFLRALRVCPNMSRAARQAGVHRSTPYENMQTDPAFREEVEDAKAEGVDLLEEACWKRATIGPEVERFVEGHIVKLRDAPSDTLAKFLLMAHRPDVYRPSQNIHHSGFLDLASAMAAGEKVRDPDAGEGDDG